MAQTGFEARSTDFNQITISRGLTDTSYHNWCISPLNSIIIFDITLFITFCNINLGRLFSLLQNLVTMSSESQSLSNILLIHSLSKHFQLKKITASRVISQEHYYLFYQSSVFTKFLPHVNSPVESNRKRNLLVLVWTFHGAKFSVLKNCYYPVDIYVLLEQMIKYVA